MFWARAFANTNASYKHQKHPLQKGYKKPTPPKLEGWEKLL